MHHAEGTLGKQPQKFDGAFTPNRPLKDALAEAKAKAKTKAKVRRA